MPQTTMKEGGGKQCNFPVQLRMSAHGWVHGYASLWFAGGKIKVIPAESGTLLHSVRDTPGGELRPAYSKDKRGKPAHISSRWHRSGLGVDGTHPDGHHKAQPGGPLFTEMRTLHDGVELRAGSGETASLRCEFSVSNPPPCAISIIPGDVTDDRCALCRKASAPKRCLQKRCGPCCESSDCNAHTKRLR